METTTKQVNQALLDMIARAQKAAEATPKGARSKQPKICACGCGLTTRGGTWMPGHDATAYSRALTEARKAIAQPTTK